MFIAAGNTQKPINCYYVMKGNELLKWATWMNLKKHYARFKKSVQKYSTYCAIPFILILYIMSPRHSREGKIIGSDIKSVVAKGWELAEGFYFIGHKGTFCNDGMFYIARLW